MLHLFIKLIFIYLFTLLASRLMGKRQVGQLQLSELVSAFFLSELATFAVTDPNVPLSYGLIPVATVIALEILISFLSIKLPFVKKLIDNPPSILIQKGKLNQKEMEKSRVTLGELMSQARQNGIGDLASVDYAVLESNGSISILPKAKTQPPSAEDLRLSVTDQGIAHALIIDGKTDESTLKHLNKTSVWLTRELKKAKLSSPKEVFLLTVSDTDEVFVIRKESP